MLPLFANDPPAPAAAPPAATVANFRDIRQHWNTATQRWDSDEYVYIGRVNPTHRLPASPWANPHHMERDTPAERERVIALYAADLAKRLQDPVERTRLEGLRGKTLVCWCSQPHKHVACHGDALVEALTVVRTTQADAALRIVPHPASIPFDAATWQASEAFPTPWHLPCEQCRAVMAYRHDRVFLARYDGEVARETEHKTKAAAKMVKLAKQHRVTMRQLQQADASKHKTDEAENNYRHERGDVRLVLKEAERRLAWLAAERARIAGEQRGERAA